MFWENLFENLVFIIIIIALCISAFLSITGCIFIVHLISSWFIDTFTIINLAIH